MRLWGYRRIHEDPPITPFFSPSGLYSNCDTKSMFPGMRPGNVVGVRWLGGMCGTAPRSGRDQVRHLAAIEAGKSGAPNRRTEMTAALLYHTENQIAPIVSNGGRGGVARLIRLCGSDLQSAEAVLVRQFGGIPFRHKTYLNSAFSVAIYFETVIRLNVSKLLNYNTHALNRLNVCEQFSLLFLPG